MGFFAAQSHAPIPTKDILSWIFDEPKHDVSAPIYIDAANPSRSLSLAESRKVVRQLIAGLRHAGVQRGDCVAVHSFNDIYYPILVLAIIGVGGVFAGTNPAYTPYELTHHIKVTKAKFLITEPEIMQNLLLAAKENNIPVQNVRIFHPLPDQKCPPGFESWTELLSHGEGDWVRFHDLNTCKATTAAHFTSSGTTGLPKAAITTHRNLIAEHELVWQSPYYHRTYQPVNLWCLPMFHAAIAPRCHTSALKMGEKAYIMRRFELEPFMRYVQDYQVTEAFLVPPIAIALIMSPLNKKYSLQSIRCGLNGAAALGKENQAKLLQLLHPEAAFTQVWGMTETTCIVSSFEFPESDTTGSVGRLRPGITAKLVDDAGNDISAYDVPGEMCVRGPTIIPGYLDNPEANKASFDREGYFHTGDVMYCDGRTKLWYIVDRKKDLIKVRGFQVAPPEIETILLQHPEIIDAAVIGVRRFPEDDGSEELSRAYVVKRPGSDAARLLTVDMVKDYAGAKLAKYKRLDGGVVFVDAIPKNASGKILKRILRDRAKNELGLDKGAKL